MRTLLVAVFAIGFFAAIVTFGMAAVSSTAHARTTKTADTYATIALVDAEQTLRSAIAAQVGAGNVNGPFAPIPAASAAPLCGPNVPTCGFLGTYAFTFSGGTDVSGAANGPDSAEAVQRADGIQENRLAVRIAVTITSAAGDLLATRSRDVTLRTLGVAPYAIVTATSDASGETVGDSAGCDGASGACAPAASADADDTRIHAIGQCRDEAYTPGACAGKNLGSTDVGSATTVTQNWNNGTNASDGWNR